MNQPNFKHHIPQIDLCVKMEVAKETEPKEKEQPKEKPKAEPKKKEEKKKETHEDEEEEEKYEEPKPKSALDNLPKSSMDLDEWKRTYSNSKIREAALPWLWEHFDPNGYCWYFCDYKYNSELEKVLMSNNLIGGWFQRLDRLRKYGFGSVLIFGAEPSLSINGVWLFRGSAIPEEMSCCDDSILYTWTKLDHTNSEDKKKIEDFLAWDGFSVQFTDQGKIYK